MLPINLMPRGPTLGTMPAALGMALMTTDLRFAAALGRTLPMAMPAVLHRHAAVVLDLLLIAELTLLGLRIAVLVFEHILMETTRMAMTPQGALFLGLPVLLAPALGADMVAAALVAAATLTAAVSGRWIVDTIKTMRQSFPEHDLCYN